VAAQPFADGRKMPRCWDRAKIHVAIQHRSGAPAIPRYGLPHSGQNLPVSKIFQVSSQDIPVPPSVVVGAGHFANQKEISFSQILGELLD